MTAIGSVPGVRLGTIGCGPGQGRSALQGIGKGVLLLGIELREKQLGDCAFVDFPHLLAQFSPFVGDADKGRATIPFTARTLHQAVLFQAVHQTREVVTLDCQHIGQLVHAPGPFGATFQAPQGVVPGIRRQPGQGQTPLDFANHRPVSPDKTEPDIGLF